MTGTPTLCELYPPGEGMMVKFRTHRCAPGSWLSGRYVNGSVRTRGDHWARSEVVEWVYDSDADVIPVQDLAGLPGRFT